MIIYTYEYVKDTNGYRVQGLIVNRHHTNVFNVNVEETFEDCVLTFDCLYKDYLEVGQYVEFVANKKELLNTVMLETKNVKYKGYNVRINMDIGVYDKNLNNNNNIQTLKYRHIISNNKIGSYWIMEVPKKGTRVNINLTRKDKTYLEKLNDGRKRNFINDYIIVPKYRLMIDEIIYKDNGLISCKCSIPKYPFSIMIFNNGKISSTSNYQSSEYIQSQIASYNNIDGWYLDNLYTDGRNRTSEVGRGLQFVRYGTTDKSLFYGSDIESPYNDKYRKVLTEHNDIKYDDKTYLEATKAYLESNDFEIRVSPIDMCLAYPKFENNQEKLKEIAEEMNIKLTDYIECNKELVGYDKADQVMMIDKNGSSAIAYYNKKNEIQYYTNVNNYDRFDNIKVYKVDEIYDTETLKSLAKRKLDDIREPKYSYNLKVKGRYNIGDIIKINPNKNVNPNKLKDNKPIYLVVRKVVFNPDDDTVSYVECGQEKANFFDEFEKRTKDIIRKTPSNINQTEFKERLNASKEIVTNSIKGDIKKEVNESIRDNVNNGEFIDLVAKKITASSISGGVAEFSELRSKIAALEELTSKKATIIDLDAVKIDTHRIDTDIANVQKLLAGEIDSISGKSIVLNSMNATIDDALITNAVMKNASIRELASGSIDTSKFTIKSSDNSLIIRDGTIQVNDNKGTSRLQIGKDKSGNYSIIINNENGENIFNSNGITSKAITTPIIRDDMIIDNANINASKININSVIDEINKDGAKTLKASKIIFDEDGQTLTTKLSKITETKTTRDVIDSTTKLSLDEVLQKLSQKNEEVVRKVETIKSSSLTSADVDKKINNLKSENNQKFIEYKKTTDKLNLDYKNLEKTVRTISNKSTNVYEILRPFNFILDSTDKLDVLRSDGQYYERPWVVKRMKNDPLSVYSGLNVINEELSDISKIHKEKRTRYNTTQFKEFMTYYLEHKADDLTPSKWTKDGIDITDDDLYYTNEIYYNTREWANTKKKPKHYVLKIVSSYPINVYVWANKKIKYNPTDSEVEEFKKRNGDFIYTKIIETSANSYEDIAVYITKRQEILTALPGNVTIFSPDKCYIKYIGATALFNEIDVINTEINNAKESVRVISDNVAGNTTKIKQSSDKIELVASKVSPREIVSTLNLAPNSVKIKSELFEINGETLIKNINGTGGTKINGDRIDVSRLYGATIYGGEFHAKRNFGGSYITGVGDGSLQIRVPSSDGARGGVFFQFTPRSTWTHAGKDYVPKGLFVGSTSKFNSGETVYATTDYLITNSGLTSSGFRYNGGVKQGAVVCTNYAQDYPISTRYKGTAFWRISFIALYTSNTEGSWIYFHDGTSSGSDFYCKTDSSTSDIKLKENITECNYKALDLINKLQFKSFDWKVDDKGYRKKRTKVGLIAQDVEKITDDIVENVGDIKRLDDFRLLHYALKGVQELSEENRQLKLENRELKSELNSIKNVINNLMKRVNKIEKEKK